MRRRGTTFAVVLLALVAAQAFAATERVRTRVVIDEVGPQPTRLHARRGTTHFVGHVAAKKRVCIRGRSIGLYYTPEEGGQSQLAGTARTNRDGEWEVRDIFLFPPGDYVAKAARKNVGSGNHTKICKAGKSKPYVRTLG